MILSTQEITIDIEAILGNEKPQYIPIDKCVTGTSEMRQSGTKVGKDDKLVGQIKKAGGLLHPIIVKDLHDDTFEILVGQRRVGAFHILKGENSKYEKIRAFVIERDLSEDEKRVISFIENFGRDDVARSDYINVIEYFYTKYGGNKAMTGRALGIDSGQVTQYLTHARLSDKVKECIKNKEFTIDIAIKALKGLGDDETSVDDDMLIETAKELAGVKPAVRKKAVKKMQAENIPAKEAVKAFVSTTTINIEVTDDQLERLHSYKDQHGYSDKEEAAAEAMDVELLRDLKP